MTSGLLHKTKTLYKNNRRHHKGYSYTIPSDDTYPYQWLWDSCFAAIAMTYFDIDGAKDELRSLVSAQFENGMIPHMIYWQRVKNDPFPKIKWGKDHTSTITQPPVLAMAVQKIYHTDGDLKFVREMLPHLDAFHRYFFRHRDPRNSNLIGVIDPDESGEDNSPRFDTALGITDPQHAFVDNFSSRLDLVDDWKKSRFVVEKRMDTYHWVRDVPINAILAESLSITSELAKQCNKTHIAKWSHAKSEAVKLAMRHYLLEDGIYYSTMDYGPHRAKIKTKTWALFMPLYAGVASDKEAHLVVSEFLNNKKSFHSTFSLPTVSMAEASFNPDGDWRGDWWVGTNWRGPVWMASNWFVIQGLRRYGFTKEAERIRNDSRALIEKSGFREYYNPINGEGHGARDFTWGGLVLDM